ncbi:MAG: membrane protein insertion efficiency factor YidD [Pirellulaceae bacterium]|nr:membrane protein insertion efficiency factor YidD [Pirellulaceae bacterium]
MGTTDQHPTVITLQRVKRWPALCAIGLVRVYQRGLSPLLGSSCRFQPTCSAYMITAIEKYGLLRGTARGCKRILRCHPFHRGGYDPP